MVAAVEFYGVSRHYGQVRAVDEVTISVAEGEFFSMLGPSGSGKTTCLRLIAGFEQPSSGSIKIFGQEAAGAKHPNCAYKWLEHSLAPATKWALQNGLALTQ